uniref:Lag1 longevity assurance 5 n=1 Tax=Echinococcus granulosus TaxID=6210 RepID=A0A068WYB4_ECHGR|nr:lag1 longevity assurance 5 [Echinococcus granulosus]
MTSEFKALSKKLDVSDAKVSYWFRAKRNSVKFPIIVKFAESGWRFSFYFCLFSYGICCLYQEPFLYDTSEFFRAYPHHEMSRCIFWYYMIELAYYVSGLIWVFVEVKRKDFIVMLTHHVVTVIRIGSVIMLLHDSADFWLEILVAGALITHLCAFPPGTSFDHRIIVLRRSSVDWLLSSPQCLRSLPHYPSTSSHLLDGSNHPDSCETLTSDARSDSEMSDTANDCTTGIHANGVAKAR